MIHTPDKIEQARELQRDGWTAPEIARKLGLAESTVRQRLPRFGKTARPHPKAKVKVCEACEATLLKASGTGLCLFCEIEAGMREPI